jgi:hypothetical protein
VWQILSSLAPRPLFKLPRLSLYRLHPSNLIKDHQSSLTSELFHTVIHSPSIHRRTTGCVLIFRYLCHLSCLDQLLAACDRVHAGAASPQLSSNCIDLPTTNQNIPIQHVYLLLRRSQSATSTTSSPEPSFSCTVSQSSQQPQESTSSLSLTKLPAPIPRR